MIPFKSMIQGRIHLTKWILVALIIILSTYFISQKKQNEPALLSKENLSEDRDQKSFFGDSKSARAQLAQLITPQIQNNQFPDTISYLDLDLEQKGAKFKFHYTIDQDLQTKAEKLLRQYQPDYGAIVMMNAETGEILTMTSFIKEQNDLPFQNLNLMATFPAASVFKIITAATAIDLKGVDPQHQIAFNGGNYTLYKKNVLSEHVTKWTRFISLKDAFARSINTAFGRLTLENIKPHELSNYANRFMFNQEIPTDFKLEKSLAQIPNETGFELTQVASGYNRFNTMSPVHGAMIAATIVNYGKMVAPYIVKEVQLNDETIYQGKKLDLGLILSQASAEKVQTMMEQTVLAGTSRKTFRKLLKDKKFKEVEMGGKTGHFSGLNPKGTNDWFVGYATDGENKVAIAAITVNIKKWTVKSSALAEMMIRDHFKNVLDEKAQSHLQLKKQDQPPLGSDQSPAVNLKSDKI